MAQLDLIRIAAENVEAFNGADWDRLKAALAPDVIYEEAGTQRRIEGADRMIAAYKEWKKAAPDGKGQITKALASGNAVTLEVTWTGTHEGPVVTRSGALAPTGKAWCVAAAQVIIFEGIKIKEFRQYFDMVTLIQQLGVTAKPESGKTATQP